MNKLRTVIWRVGFVQEKMMMQLCLLAWTVLAVSSWWSATSKYRAGFEHIFWRVLNGLEWTNASKISTPSSKYVRYCWSKSWVIIIEWPGRSPRSIRSRSIFSISGPEAFKLVCRIPGKLGGCCGSFQQQLPDSELPIF